MNQNTESVTELDPSLFGRVAVIYGGASSEREISLRSGKEVLTSLVRSGVDAFGIDLCGDGQSPVKQVLEAEFDRVFLILHGPGGEDGTIQGLLEMLQTPYTGSAVAASALGMDKLRCKQLWQGAGLPTPEYRVLNRIEDLSDAAESLGWPMIVKPAHEGSSIGISKVADMSQLENAWHQAEGYDRSVIAERWMSGAEFTVAVLEQSALPVIRLETGHEFYDYDAKYCSSETRYLFEHGLTDAQEQELMALAVKAFQVVGCRGWARVDVMQNEQGAFQLLEVNTAPGMTDHSLVPMAAAKASITFDQLVLKILATTL